MAERRDGGRRDASGTDGGTDVEPLRGGMQEVEGGRGGPEHRAEADPPSPYHDAAVPEGGLAPREAGVHGASGLGSVPEKAAAEVNRDATRKLGQERGDDENEAGNAPREDPGAPRAGERH
ncbi:MAG: hypothetical protein ACJ79E_08055 [Anaeromyxobacteraceae bacterium]